MTTTWSVTDKSAAITLTAVNLTATLSSATQSGVRSNSSKVTSGKFYWEIVAGPVGGANFGIANATWSETAAGTLGTSLNAVGVNAAGQVFLNSVQVTTVSSFVNGNTLSFALDLGAKTLGWRTGAGNWNNNGANNPATGATDISGMNAGPYFVAFGSNVNADAGTADFGATPFAQAVPSGYSAWDGTVWFESGGLLTPVPQLFRASGGSPT